jgi:hypothetical protein
MLLIGEPQPCMFSRPMVRRSESLKNCFVQCCRKMKPVYCALVLGLGGCDYSPGPPNFVTEGDSSFIVTCVPSACAQRATAICLAQGYSRYDILERRQGDALGEGGAIVVQCKK